MYVFGIDGLHALQLAMQCAGAVLESTEHRLEWLGQNEDLGMPKFLPWLPKPQQARKVKRSKLSMGRKRSTVPAES